MFLFISAELTNASVRVSETRRPNKWPVETKTSAWRLVTTQMFCQRELETNEDSSVRASFNELCSDGGSTQITAVKVLTLHSTTTVYIVGCLIGHEWLKKKSSCCSSSCCSSSILSVNEGGEASIHPPWEGDYPQDLNKVLTDWAAFTVNTNNLFSSTHFTNRTLVVKRFFKGSAAWSDHPGFICRGTPSLKTIQNVKDQSCQQFGLFSEFFKRNSFSSSSVMHQTHWPVRLLSGGSITFSLRTFCRGTFKSSSSLSLTAARSVSVMSWGDRQKICSCSLICRFMDFRIKAGEHEGGGGEQRRRQNIKIKSVFTEIL